MPFLAGFHAASWLLLVTLALFAGKVFAAPVLSFDRMERAVDLRGQAEYAVMRSGALDPQSVWELPGTAFKRGRPDLMLDLPEGAMLVMRVEIDVPQMHDPDYLELPSARLDRVRYWARSSGSPSWQTAEAGDRVPPPRWSFSGPYPAFELPSAGQRTQIVLAIEHRGLLNVPVQWVSDQVFRVERMGHAFKFGLMTGLALALAAACAVATALFRKTVFALLCLYTLLMAVQVVANNGYGDIYLWPWMPELDDPAKPFVSMLLSCLLVPLVALVLNADVHKHAWWVGAWRWGLAGLVYALVQAWLLPPEWRLLAGTAYVLFSLLFAGILSMHGVLRSDAMSAWALAGTGLIAMSTLLGYADYTALHGSVVLNMIGTGCRMGFVVLMLGVAVQRHRFGRDVLSRALSASGRDALTGLLTRPGFEHALAKSSLMTEHASAFSSGFMVCDLRSLGTVRSEYGEDICERVLVRFAAVLQRTLHSDSIIGRIGYGRFAAVLVQDVDTSTLQATATQVLTRVLAQSDLPDFVRQLKLRMVLAQMPLSQVHLADLENRCNSVMQGGDSARVIRWL
ncbi:diguanylate cyclase domain-containing protein [Variovorax terrae]|uniref:Diguanylate cyclase n=1 Tax=Variovorax terrae TaxID=2923278 RepID=A0A9X1VT09_9BURK|nr:diguanylate cyclase [Variovorax terrae]MCJ0762792.1 diguanylate cyclase [Variovorax terrae]